MSAQGTVDGAYTHELFLDAWGQWARGNNSGGSARRGSLNEAPALGGLVWVFTDDEMLIIDQLVAQLPAELKTAIKRMHLRQREPESDAERRRYESAVIAFMALLALAEQSGDLEVLFVGGEPQGGV